MLYSSKLKTTTPRFSVGEEELKILNKNLYNQLLEREKYALENDFNPCDFYDVIVLATEKVIFHMEMSLRSFWI